MNHYLFVALVLVFASVSAQVWVRTKMAGTSNEDLANTIDTDTNGNIYIGGFTSGNLDSQSYSSGKDIFVMKYNSAGTKQWTKTMGTSANEIVTNLVTDTNGNVYVTGYTTGNLDGQTNAGSADAYFIKYDSSGAKQFIKLFGTTSAEYGNAISIDSSGNIFVVGTTYGALDSKTNAGYSDLFIRKHGTSGAVTWTVVIGTGNYEDGLASVVDTSGNIYATGYTQGNFDGKSNSGASDIFLIKYNSAGTKQWSSLRGTSGSDSGQAIAIDTSGNLYVTGYVAATLDSQPYASGTSDIVVLKYSTGGSYMWTRLEGSSGADEGNGVSIDSYGNVFVVGHVAGSVNSLSYLGSNDMILLKYTSSGTLSWAVQMGTANDDGAQAVNVDSTGLIHVAGYASASMNGQSYASNKDIALVTYDDPLPSMSPSNFPSKTPSVPPSAVPSCAPTVKPTSVPTISPTCVPSQAPSLGPTAQPTKVPTVSPTFQPSYLPTVQPTYIPSYSPTAMPTYTPSCQPSLSPTNRPTAIPTQLPSCLPTAQPTFSPTFIPSLFPTLTPTASPSFAPSRLPTGQPSSQPSSRPTSQPSIQPSRQPYSRPSSQPTQQPWSNPSSQPTVQPSKRPSSQPSSQPSCQPFSDPTSQPSGQPSARPSAQPSRQPSSQPSSQPNGRPTGQPSARPSVQPSCQPSRQPFSDPTSQPSGQPSARPSAQPSSQPSRQPSSQPTSRPSGQPSARPSAQPSSQPSRQPSCQPTSRPSGQPSAMPSAQPSRQPSRQPSCQPTSRPSGQPSAMPSAQPSSQPSHQPFSDPTSQPSGQPSAKPSTQPSSQPSRQPSRQPTVRPTVQPSRQPLSNPSSQPSVRPTSQPSFQPSSQPSRIPTCQPSRQPNARPSAHPSGQPSLHPTVQPSTQPSRQPSSVPSSQPQNCPTSCPSMQPTITPSSLPTNQPSAVPSRYPSSCPSLTPTTLPSAQPSCRPSSAPSSQPAAHPSNQPSGQPTSIPTSQPVGKPSQSPSQQPSSRPTVQPSAQPSKAPTSQPSTHPSSRPNSQPSAQPSSQPIAYPTGKPSEQPTNQPSLQPSQQPSGIPTRQPSAQPTAQPIRLPSLSPSGQPTGQPSGHPTVAPSVFPTGQPSGQPSHHPSGQPSQQPSRLPSGQPSGKPSGQPSRQPSGTPSRQPMSEPSSHPSSQPTTQPIAPTVRPSTLVPSLAPQSTLSWRPSLATRVPTTALQGNAQQIFDRFVGSAKNSSTTGTNGTQSLQSQVNLANSALDALTKSLLNSSSGETKVVQVSTDDVRITVSVVTLPPRNASVNGTASNATIFLPSVTIPNSQTSVNIAAPVGSSSSSSTVVVSVVEYDRDLLLAKARNDSAKNSSSSSSAGKLVSDVVSVKLSTTNSSSGTQVVTLPSFVANMSVDAASKDEDEVPILAHNCSIGVRETILVTCTESNVVMNLTCSGRSEVHVRRQCPVPRRVCNLLNLRDLSVASSDYCRAEQTSAGFVTCICGFSNSSSTTAASIIGSGGAVNVAVMTEFVAGDFGTTVAIGSSIGSSDFAQRSSSVFLVFGLLWGIGALIIGVYFARKEKKPSTAQTSATNSTNFGSNTALKKIAHNKIAVLPVVPSSTSTSTLTSSSTVTSVTVDQQIAQLQLVWRAYISRALPTVFQITRLVWWQRLWLQFCKHHSYVKIAVTLLSSHRHHDSQEEKLSEKTNVSGMEEVEQEDEEHERVTAVTELIQALTLVTISFFVLAMLYDLQYPSDDGSCILFTDEASCLGRRSLLDPQLTYCYWKAVEVFSPGSLVEMKGGVVVQTIDLTSDVQDSSIADKLHPCTFNTGDDSILAQALSIVITSTLSMPATFILNTLFAVIRARSHKELTEKQQRGVRRQEQMKKQRSLKASSVSPVLGQLNEDLDGDKGGVDSTRDDRIDEHSGSPDATRPATLVKEDKNELENGREEFKRYSETERFPDEAADNVAMRLARATAPNDDSVIACESNTGNGRRTWFWTRNGGDMDDNSADVRSQEVPKSLVQSRRALLTQLHLLHLQQQSFNNADNQANVFVPPALRRSGSPSSKEQRRQLRDAEELITQLRYASNAEYGMVLLHHLLADTLHQLSTSASSVTASRDYFAAQRFFLHAVHKDFVVETTTSSDVAKYAAIALITCINLGALFFVALKGIQRGSAWQRSFLSVCLLEWLVDVAFMETMEVVWVDFFLPGFVLSEVQAAVQRLCRLSETYIERLLHAPASSAKGKSRRTQQRNRVHLSSASIVSSHYSSDRLLQSLARHKATLPESQLALLLLNTECKEISNTPSARFASNNFRTDATDDIDINVTAMPAATLTREVSDQSSEPPYAKANNNKHQSKRKRLHLLYLLSMLPLELHVFFTRTLATVFLGAMVYTWFSLKKVTYLRLLWMALLILVVMFGFVGLFVWFLHYQAATVKRRVSVFMPAYIPPPSAENRSLSTSSLSAASSSTSVKSLAMLSSPVSSTSTELLVRSSSLLCMPRIDENEAEDEVVVKGVASGGRDVHLDEEKGEETKSSSLSFGSSTRWSSLMSSSSASIATVDGNPPVHGNVLHKDFHLGNNHDEDYGREANDHIALRLRQSSSDHPIHSDDGADSAAFDGAVGGSSVWTVSTQSSAGRIKGDVKAPGSNNDDDSMSASDRQLESFVLLDQDEDAPDYESKVEVEAESEDSFHHSYGCRRRRLSSTSAGTLDLHDIIEDEDDDASLYSLHLSLSSSRATSSRRTSLSSLKTRHLHS